MSMSGGAAPGVECCFCLVFLCAIFVGVTYPVLSSILSGPVLRRSSQGAREKALIAYSEKVVQALGIFHGPSHMEVMYNDVTGPCLVEVGSRCHGGEGTWVPVAEECLGYSQLDTNLNAFLRPDRFDALPFEPGT